MIDGTARRLVLSGYAPISGRYRMLARIDREDWKEFMGRSGGGMRWVNELGASAADHYRRCFSKDRITVEPELFRYTKRLVTRIHGYSGPDHYLERRERRVRMLLI